MHEILQQLPVWCGMVCKTFSGENNYLIPCWFCTFVHWQINDQSIILIVGLFEQWEKEQQQKNPEKRI